MKFKDFKHKFKGSPWVFNASQISSIGYKKKSDAIFKAFPGVFQKSMLSQKLFSKFKDFQAHCSMDKIGTT